MENKLAIKVYDIDYSFIIKNYLNPELWDKQWTLFVYKTFIVTLSLRSVWMEEKKIYFNLKLRDTRESEIYEKDYWRVPNNTVEISVDYSLKINDAKFLKKQINSKIIVAIKELETMKIRTTQEFKDIKYMEQAEEDKLRELAENFLDDNNVYNEDIREVYIENYIDNNKQIDSYRNNYLYKNEYLKLTELYLIFAKTVDDKELEEKVLKSNQNNEKISELLLEVQEYYDNIETEEFEKEMQDKLENI